MVPDYIRPGDVQNLGTGAALTSFLPLPGGGFYDNYRDKTSPQGIRPISKSGIFYGTADELEAEINLWRAKLGKRGRLAVEWDNGALRWQWARLQNLDTPRPREAKGGWLPFTMTWITAAQNWRGVVYGEEDWTVDDGSFVIGDGSAEIGVGAQVFTLNDADEVVSVTHNGSIDATNVTLRIEMTGTWEDITIVNETTGQEIVFVFVGDSTRRLFEVNAGARSIAVGGPQIGISSISRTGNFVHATTSALHGLTTGDGVRVEGTDRYNGDWYPITTEGTSAFYFIVPGSNRSYGATNGGTVRRFLNKYNEATFSDIAQWFVLAPGVNTLRITWGTFPTSATLTVEFADHYA